MNRRHHLQALALAFVGADLARADEAWPRRPIRWIVPFLPGTSPDNTVRILAEAMGAALKQTIVVENRAGAGGNLGAQAAARAAPDGYTWVYSGSPMAAGMRMYTRPGFDVNEDFVHIGRIGVSDLAVVVRSEGGPASLQALLARAKQSPGAVMYATGGVGSPAHLAAEAMLRAAGATATHVPYKGATESTKAVLSKDVDFAVAITSVALPQVDQGKLAALAVTAPQRHRRLPKVPTLAEAGVPVAFTSSGGLSLPAGTPPAIVRRVTEVLNDALARPEVRTRIEDLGGRVAPTTPQAYAALLRQEIDATEKLMAAARIEAQ
ncbi:tripartite tricarboxylate transporter substrate binding protein [Piscinibacter sakaiensis]|uniref:Putative exported protein n=1 Tax=Piscinibacter sakaiensis TaxID=1547922 RepID=A0A0K8P0Z1_PISS1|nr:tripartite tricarboxylate transporter substrate binding protein [Piscinibacter sakaiensis]GAP36199.1 putative exported protein [Piscinibacter sakaiensis]